MDDKGAMSIIKAEKWDVIKEVLALGKSEGEKEVALIKTGVGSDAAARIVERNKPAVKK